MGPKHPHARQPDHSQIGSARIRGQVNERCSPLRSNLAFWQQLQDDGYFEKHPLYRGLMDIDGDDVVVIETFRRLTPESVAVVIGCGYGRETAQIAPRVRHVYGIDVNDAILTKAVAYLSQRGISNFTPVAAERYKTRSPMESIWPSRMQSCST